MTLIHRPAAVAGQFYPDKVTTLQSDINHYLNEVGNTSKSTIRKMDISKLKAIIVPHAGYIYSGSIAASAFNLLKTRKNTITTVILLGPAHRVAFPGIAASTANYFESPLGSVELNQPLINKIKEFDFISYNDKAHQDEHSIEVQLPFLQTVLHNFTVVPLLVGNCDSDDVATILNYLWGEEETLIVISSDLSHFNNYTIATQIDNKTSQAILNLQPENISFNDACGRTPVNGLLKTAQKKNLNVTILDVRNSGDTAGDKERVVGYGAYSFTEN